MAVGLNRGAIIGGGIGGLCTAIALQNIGLQVSVFEKRPTFEEAGAGLTLWSNAVKGLFRLGITEEDLGGARISRSEIRDWKGRVLKGTDVSRLSAGFGAPTVAVHRADLHRALLTQLQAGVVRLGHEATEIEQFSDRVEIRFSDNSREEYDMLVGADGIHSSTRMLLFPNRMPRYSGYAAWRGIAAFTDPELHQCTSESWGRGQRFGIVPIDRDRIYWFATANVPAGRKLSPLERKDELCRRFRGWHAPIEALIEATPPEAVLYNDIHDLVPFSPWTLGRVTLLGDAVHATTPNMGQGACQAIESSIVLARCLEEENTLPAALLRYERERRPRTSWITNQSWQIGQAGQIENSLICTARDLVLRMAPNSMMETQLKKAAGFEV